MDPDGPSPFSYNTQRGTNAQPHFTMGGRLPPTNVNNTPGVGSYNI